MTQESNQSAHLAAAPGSLESLRSMLAGSEVAVGVSDPSGAIVFANEALLRMFRYSEEFEVAGRSVLDMIAPVARETIATFMRRRAMGEQVPGIYRARGLRGDGTEMPIEVRTTSVDLNGAPHIFSLLYEIAEQEQSLPTGESAEALYRAFFSVNTAVKLLIEPTTGQIVDANHAAVEMYGWSREELVSMRITEINMLSQEEVKKEMDLARSGGRRYFRFRHRTARGDIRHVEVHSGPVELEGRILLLSIIHDVTERDALEDQLRESQRLEVVGRLAGGVAHDFNNLLTVILSAADMLSAHIEDASALRPYLEDLRHASHRAADLTRDLLAFARRQVLEARPVYLEQLLLGVSDLLRRTLGPKYELDCSAQHGLPPVLSDPGRLEQVILNLAVNARDAMPAGGRIRIALRRPSPPDLPAPGVPAGDWVLLEVSDEGEGMDEQTRSRVFEPFFTTKPGRGSGLGLSIVHGIVVQNRGHVVVRSRPGLGSTFEVYLPVVESDVREGASPQPPADKAQQRGQLLLVDDMPTVRRVLAQGLRQAGFTVREARSGREVLALDAEELSLFDALISDVIMPDMSGVELVWELSKRAPNLPVILMSGELRDHALNSLPDGVRFVAKPFPPDRLAQEIRSLLESALRS